MKALSFYVILNSLFSVRIPYTWQSALTYPILPPSAVIGMIANALQRFLNKKHPIEYLKDLESEIELAVSQISSPCIVKSYTMSAITKWGVELGGKFTNALGRQFAYTTKMQFIIVFKSENTLNNLVNALKTTVITCGDSESPATVIADSITIHDVHEEKYKPNTEISTSFPFQFNFDTMKIKGGSGKLYMMHKRCLKNEKEKSFPLYSYLCPLEEKEGIIYPSSVCINSKEELPFYKIFVNKKECMLIA